MSIGDLVDDENNESDDEDNNDSDDNKLNEIAPYIGLSDTFRPRRVVVLTSTSGVYEIVPTSGTARDLAHRVVVDQGR